MSRARTRPKGKPTPSRREREQSRREAISPGNDILAGFANALSKRKAHDDLTETRKAILANGSEAERFKPVKGSANALSLIDRIGNGSTFIDNKGRAK